MTALTLASLRILGAILSANRFDLGPRFVNNGADVFRLDVANAVLQFGERFAQSGVEMLISGDDLAQFLQAGYLGDEAKQADFGGCREEVRSAPGVSERGAQGRDAFTTNIMASRTGGRHFT